MLSRAWAAGAGPGEGPLTIDLDSTMCETYGLAKEGARHHGYTGKRGYHPLLAIATGTGDVLMSRLREGRANTVRGAAHFHENGGESPKSWRPVRRHHCGIFYGGQEGLPCFLVFEYAPMIDVDDRPATYRVGVYDNLPVVPHRLIEVERRRVDEVDLPGLQQGQPGLDIRDLEDLDLIHELILGAGVT